mgnify:CR=1 FL=1
MVWCFAGSIGFQPPGFWLLQMPWSGLWIVANSFALAPLSPNGFTHPQILRVCQKRPYGVCSSALWKPFGCRQDRRHCYCRTIRFPQRYRAPPCIFRHSCTPFVFELLAEFRRNSRVVVLPRVQAGKHANRAFNLLLALQSPLKAAKINISAGLHETLTFTSRGEKAD